MSYGLLVSVASVIFSVDVINYQAFLKLFQSYVFIQNYKRELQTCFFNLKNMVQKQSHRRNQDQQTFYTDPRALIYSKKIKGANDKAEIDEKLINGRRTDQQRDGDNINVIYNRFKSTKTQNDEVGPKVKGHSFWSRLTKSRKPNHHTSIITSSNVIDKNPIEQIKAIERPLQSMGKSVGIQVSTSKKNLLDPSLYKPVTIMMPRYADNRNFLHRNIHSYTHQDNFSKDPIFVTSMQPAREDFSVENKISSYADDLRRPPAEDDYPIASSDVIDYVSENLLVNRINHTPIFQPIEHHYNQYNCLPTNENISDGTMTLTRGRAHNYEINDAVSMLNDNERMFITQFYKCMGSSVYVSTSPAIMFINSVDAALTLTEWKRLYIGVPILVFNIGLFKSKPRKLQLIIGELGSGFILIDTTIDWRSDIKQPRPGFITLKTKDNHTVVALRFFCVNSSIEFYKHFRKIADDPQNADIFDSEFNSTIRKNKKGNRQSSLYRYAIQRISKKAISFPIGFKHVNSIRCGNNDKTNFSNKTKIESLYSIRALL
ncbi:hypothetical protein GJ496_001656 [Pomphorhynchus laevis]|nr:hypothetical protein GJ496_001656 [Pomphorhynchus laevis]